MDAEKEMSMPAAAEAVAAGDLECRVTVADADSLSAEPKWFVKAWRWKITFLLSIISRVSEFVRNALKIGTDDPRRVVHGVKVATALTLVSLFYYIRPVYDGLGGSAMWAVMTVIVAFEYTVGGSLCKGINRAFATAFAGFLAVGIHWIASKSGKRFEPVILSASVFILAMAGTFSRFIPILKARFDYGIMVFILTFSLVAVSGYRVPELLELAEHRILTIFLGVAICLLVCVLVCPVWAGEELHKLVCSNMEKLADSLEGCVHDYFMKDDKLEGKEYSSSNRSNSYRDVLNTKAVEEMQANMARWEPGHGSFLFRHPWSQYLKVGAAMRGCAYCFEALNACINSEIPLCKNVMKKEMREVCMRASLDSSKVLKELASSMKSMRKLSSSVRFSVEDMKNAIDELQNALGSILTLEATSKEDEGFSSTLMEASSLITAVSLLVEIAGRIESIAAAVDVLATLAGFEQKPSTGDEPSSCTTPLEGEDGILELPEV